MGWLIWAGILPRLPGRGLAHPAGGPLRQFVEDLHVDQARELVPPAARVAGGPVPRRPWAGSIPSSGSRWEEAHWHDEVLWARDRQTRRLLALIGVHFEPDPFDDLAEPRRATPRPSSSSARAAGTPRASGSTRSGPTRPCAATSGSSRSSSCIRSRRSLIRRTRSTRPLALTRGSSPSSPSGARGTPPGRSRSDRQISSSGCSSRSTSAQASASFGAISSGMMQTPCLSAWIRSPGRISTPAES